MATPNNGGNNLVTLLLEDHQAMKTLLSQIDQPDIDVEALFRHITREMVIHEVAEEEVLYPAVRRWVDGGEALAEARIEEESEGETLLATMEHMDPHTEEFGSLLRQLRDAVLAHAAKEETEVFPALERSAADRLDALGAAYRAAKSVAPTRPHPNAPNTPPGNVIVGIPAAIVDRVSDAVRRVLEGVASRG